MLSRARLLAVLLAALAVAALAGGCGGSDSDSVSRQELEAARAAGEAAAEERSRVDRLERQVRSLRRAKGGGAAADDAVPTAVAEQAEEAISSAAGASFHAPSGNVSCQIHGDEALCAVASIDATFVLGGGTAARMEPGAAIASGSGDSVPYGSKITAGSITCAVPRSNEPRGVTCVDAASGHGFEASRVPSRQRTY